MRNTRDGLRRATHIFEAAAWHYALKPVCRCGHSATFNPHGLWWHFQKRHWDDNLRDARRRFWCRSEEHTSELQSLMRISYAVFCLNKKNQLIYSYHYITHKQTSSI